MASPQKENGYIPIATEIIQAMQKTHWSSSEIRVIFCIFEKTYGWHKKEDWISLSQLSKMTGLLPQHISRTIKGLIKRKIIKKNNKLIGFNKDYEDWGLPKLVIPKLVEGVTKNGIKLLPKLVTTIDTTKDIIQKKTNDDSFKRKKYDDDWVDIDFKSPFNKEHNTKKGIWVVEDRRGKRHFFHKGKIIKYK